MTDHTNLTGDILAKLDGVDQLRPADELAAYEQVLTELTELLNAPETQGPGAG
ncbi:hypothetical protein GCM10009720_07080 [Yaniella flava]|uniref:Uncharacterized protein n=1 Tax=Yaniella flava TaxID=287930 RepID=A0ABN2U6N5_9MICC